MKNCLPVQSASFNELLARSHARYWPHATLNTKNRRQLRHFRALNL